MFVKFTRHFNDVSEGKQRAVSMQVVQLTVDFIWITEQHFFEVKRLIYKFY